MLISLELEPNNNPITSEVVVDPVLDIRNLVKEYSPDIYKVMVMPSQNHAPLMRRVTIDNQSSDEDKRKNIDVILNVIRAGFEFKYGLTK